MIVCFLSFFHSIYATGPSHPRPGSQVAFPTNATVFPANLARALSSSALHVPHLRHALDNNTFPNTQTAPAKTRTTPDGRYYIGGTYFQSVLQAIASSTSMVRDSLVSELLTLLPNNQYGFSTGCRMHLEACMTDLRNLPDSQWYRAMLSLFAATIAGLGPIYLSVERPNIELAMIIGFGCMCLSIFASAQGYIQAETALPKKENLENNMLTLFDLCNHLRSAYTTSSINDPQDALPPDILALAVNQAWLLRPPEWPAEEIWRNGNHMLTVLPDGKFTIKKETGEQELQKINKDYAWWNSMNQFSRMFALPFALLAPSINAAWCVLYLVDYFFGDYNHTNTANVKTSSALGQTFGQTYFVFNYFLNPIVASIATITKALLWWCSRKMAQNYDIHSKTQQLLKELAKQQPEDGDLGALVNLSARHHHNRRRSLRDFAISPLASREPVVVTDSTGTT